MRYARAYAFALLAGSASWSGYALAEDEAEAGPIRFDFEAVFASRTPSTGVYVEDTVGGTPVISGSDLPFGWAPGIDASFTAERGDKDYELRFLGGLIFTATDQTTTPPIWSFVTVPPLFGLGVADIDTIYVSSFNSLEFNAGIPMEMVHIFGGIRGVVINESLTSNADFGGNQATVAFDAVTGGLGPQIGADVRFGDDIFVELDGRAALLRTRSQLDLSVEQAIGPAFTASGNPWGWATLFEAGISAGAKVGPATSLTVGYRATLVRDVPTSISMVPAVDVVTPTIGRAGDSFIIHGLTAGIEGEF